MVGFSMYGEMEKGCWGGKGDCWFLYVRLDGRRMLGCKG